MQKPQHEKYAYFVKGLTKEQHRLLVQIRHAVPCKTSSGAFKRIIDLYLEQNVRLLNFMAKYYKLEDEYRRQNELIEQQREFVQTIRDKLLSE